MSPLDKVFEPVFLRKLDRLRFVVRQSFATRPGNTPMPSGSQPRGLEVTSFKNYAPGDDLRYLDWNVYGRLDQMRVKTFRAEREAPLYIFLDTSASMAVPSRDEKLAFATALAASLAYISLRNQDPVRVIGLGTSQGTAPVSPWYRHSNRLHELAAFLKTIEAQGSKTIADAVAAHLQSSRTPGVAVVLSDFLVEPSGYESALGQLLASGCNVAALRVIGPEERDPNLSSGAIRLRDAETGAERSIAITPQTRERYQAALRKHLDHLERWAQTHEVTFATPQTDAGLETCLLGSLTRAGLLR